MKTTTFFCVCAFAFSCLLECDAALAEDGFGLTYEVTIVNEWQGTVRFKRAADENEAMADLSSGQSETFNIRFDSDQVFMAWGNKKLLGEPIVFKPKREFGGISLRVTTNGKLVVALKSR